MQRLSATIILQKSSQVSLYFKLYANINSFKISQCFAILQQALIECKALVSTNHNTQRIPFSKPFYLNISLISLLNLHFSCNLVAFIALLFGRAGVTFPGCQADGLSVKPKRWNNSQCWGKFKWAEKSFSECFHPLAPRVEMQNMEVEFFIQRKTELPKTMQRRGRKKLPAKMSSQLGELEMLLLFFSFKQLWFTEKRAFRKP